MKSIAILTLSLSMSAGICTAETSRTAGPPAKVIPITPAYINQLSEEMRTNNPGLRSAQAQVRAADAGVRAVRTWEDPMLNVGGMGANSMMREQEGDMIYGVEQKLPLFGKPRLARAMAQAEAATEQANQTYQFQTLRRDLAKTLFRTALADRVVQIGEEDRGWLETMVRATAAKYRTDEATLAELIELENKLAERTNQLRTDLNLLDNERFGLNRLLNRGLQAPWPTLELPPVAPSIPYSDSLVQMGLKNEPKALVMRQQLKQTSAALDLTRRQRYPDLSAGLEARNYSGDGSFRQEMFALRLNLPWVNSGKYRSEIHRDEARLRATQLGLADWELGVQQDIHHLTITIDAARRGAVLYRDEIIPRSKQALASAQTAWETGRRTLREVLETRRMLLEARLMYARAVAEQYQMMSELVLCCGLGDFEALQMIGIEVPSQPTRSFDKK